MVFHLKDVSITASGIEYLTKFEMKWLNLLWKFPNCLQESLLTACLIKMGTSYLKVVYIGYSN